jgi:hypothetical protein
MSTFGKDVKDNGHKTSYAGVDGKITSAMLLRIQNNYGIDLDFSPPSPPRAENAYDNSLQTKRLLLGGESGEPMGVTA